MTCFICKHMRMCYVFREMHQLVRFNTLHVDYSKNHDKFFKTLAEVCEVYEDEKKED